jgi:hypothetical protein
MVLSKSDLIASLQNEVRVLLHLVGKVDRAQLDYRPTPGQRSTLELVRYLSMMGPTLIAYALGTPPDIAVWTSAEEASKSLDFDQAIAQIAAHHDRYAALLAPVPDARFGETFTDFDGTQTKLGIFIVTYALMGLAAYKTQLFVYLKACGRDELSSANPWDGVDAPAA